MSVIQDCAAWERTLPRIKLADIGQHLSSADAMYKYYSAEYWVWIRIPPVYVQIVRTDQPLLGRRLEVLDSVNEDSYISRLHAFLNLPLLAPSPLRTRPASATTCQHPRPLKLIEIEVDDEVEVKVDELPMKRAKVAKLKDYNDELIQPSIELPVVV
ncbi:hypothetical protein K438DRAFT_1785544 [Mycena galopus ATCC 62051]|nr:hypothetical protein K438DRAFT_1785544 [Mycena galopus ATCC 62051]